MATYYVDASVGSSGSGTSGSPFKDISDVPGLSAGDTVKFSCGSTGQTRTYNVPASPGYWNPGNGSAGNPIIVKVWDDDSAHGTGTAIFETSLYQLLSGPNYITFSGKYLSDGLKHFKLGTSFQTREEFSNINHFHVEYVDGSDGSLGFGSFSSLVGCEVNHCSINNIDLLGNVYDHGIRFLGCAGAGGSTYGDAMNFHHNTISVYRLATGVGNDGIQCSGVGYSIHHNTITGVFNASYYVAGQHQDGMQDTGLSSNIQIYDNDIVNINNYGIFMEAAYGGFVNLYIWNNILRWTDNALNAGTGGAIVVGINGSFSSFPIIMTNIIVGNNLIVDYNNGNPAASLNNDPNLSVTWTNTALYNNVGVNGTTSVSTNNNPTCVNSGNVFMTAAQAGTGGSRGFVSYTAFDNNNNYQINSTSSPQYHAGSNGALTYYTTDYLGNTYNASTPSSGPYEFSGGGGATFSSSMVGKVVLSGKVTIK